MLTRAVRIQILAFVMIALLGVSYAGAKYAGLDRLLGPRGYVVNMQLAESGGIFENAEVTYNGVPVGKVGTLQLTKNGVQVPLDIEPDTPRVPSDVEAVVANRSAVGEQYVDLRPKHQKGPYLEEGSVIAQESTRTPLPVEDLMMNMDSFAKSVPQDSLRTVVTELGTAFRGNGGNLQTILDTTREFTSEAQKRLPQTKQLLADGKTVLATQNEQGSAIRSFGQDVRSLSAQLERSDGDLRNLIDKAPKAGRQVSGVLDETGPQLGDLVGNLTTTSEQLAAKNDGLEQLMVTYPMVSAGGYSVAPGDGQAHFGLVLNVFDPLPCTEGYEGTTKRPGNDLAPVPLNTGAHCAEPPGSPTDVRGAQNAPR